MWVCVCMRDGEIEIKVGIVRERDVTEYWQHLYIKGHTYIVFTNYFFVYLRSNSSILVYHFLQHAQHFALPG